MYERCFLIFVECWYRLEFFEYVCEDAGISVRMVKNAPGSRICVPSIISAAEVSKSERSDASRVVLMSKSALCFEALFQSAMPSFEDPVGLRVVNRCGDMFSAHERC